MYVLFQKMFRHNVLLFTLHVPFKNTNPVSHVTDRYLDSHINSTLLVPGFYAPDTSTPNLWETALCLRFWTERSSFLCCSRNRG